jgi:hypothetical protein
MCVKSTNFPGSPNDPNSSTRIRCDGCEETIKVDDCFIWQGEPVCEDCFLKRLDDSDDPLFDVYDPLSENDNLCHICRYPTGNTAVSIQGKIYCPDHLKTAIECVPLVDILNQVSGGY